MIESLELMAKGRVNPSGLITHIGGLNAAIDTTLNLPDIPGGKKLIYTHFDLPLVALDELANQPGNYSVNWIESSPPTKDSGVPKQKDSFLNMHHAYRKKKYERNLLSYRYRCLERTNYCWAYQKRSA